ncbi:MAG TPA: protein kinase [Polyangiaceae bacterium]|nr:protein kinase [Polyangiaceae bacterium]
MAARGVQEHQAPVEASGAASGSRVIQGGSPPNLPKRFSVATELGRGANGVVFRVTDAELGTEAALKTFHSLAADEIFYLKREFRALADIKHANLVDLYELFASPELTFFTMELVPGSHILKALAPESTEARDFRLLREVFSQLALGLIALHRAGRLHRDVKPSNVLVTPTGRVVLLDFGLVAPTNPQRAWVGELTGMVGTLAYMAPEQAYGTPSSPAGDWYSFGAVLCEALVGRPPLDPHSKSFFRKRAEDQLDALLGPELPADLCELVRGCLAYAPERRLSGESVLEKLGFRSPTGVPVGNEMDQAASIPFAGRRGELARLDAALERVRRSRQIELEYVSGPSGVGKTELIRHFLQTAAEKGSVLSFRGRCHPRENLAHNALDGIVDDLSQFLALRSPAGLGAPLRVLERQFPVLRRLPLEDERTSLPDDDPGAGNESAARASARALLTIFARLSRQQPLIIWVDDVHWGDADSGAVLRQLMMPGAETAAVLLILSFRSDERAQSATLAALDTERAIPVEELELAPLPATDSEWLVRQVLGAAETDALVQRVVGEAGGSPLFLWELARFVQESDGVSAVPPQLSFRYSLSRRLERLPKEARSLLELSSVAGGALEQGVLLKAAELPEGARPQLAMLENAALLRSSLGTSGRAFEIYHHRIRDEILNALETTDKQRHHSMLARTLLATANPNLPVVVEHYHAAGNIDAVRRYVVPAARQAFSALGYQLAARLYQTASELGGSELAPPDLAVELARSLAAAGRALEAGRAFELAARLAREAGLASERVQVLRRRAGEQFLRSGHAEPRAGIIDAALRDLGVRVPTKRWQALAMGSALRVRTWLRGLDCPPPAEALPETTRDRLELWFLLCLTESRVNHTRSGLASVSYLYEALEAGDPDHVLRALCVEASTASALPFAFAQRAAKGMLQRASELLPRTTDEYWRNAFQLARGCVAYFNGELQSAATDLAASAEIYRRYGTRAALELALVEGFRLPTLAHLGRLREVRASFERALEDAEARNDRFLLLNLPARQIALGLLLDGQVERALEHANRTLEQAPSDYSSQHWDAFMALTEIDLYRGAGDAAWARVLEHWPRLKANQFLLLNFLRDDLWNLRGRAALAAAEGVPPGSRERGRLLAHALAAADAIERNRLPAVRGFADVLRAGVAALEGDRERGRAALERALAASTAAGLELHAAAVAASLASLGKSGALEARAAADFERIGTKDVAAWLRLITPALST